MASALVTAGKPFLQSAPARCPRAPTSAPAALRAPHWTRPSSRRSALAVRALKWEPSKVAPQADRVLIRLEELPEKSAGGVLLPKSAVKFERYLMGEILSVGSDVSEVEAGKKVLFSDINAYEVDIGSDAKHSFCKAGDLLAVVE